MYKSLSTDDKDLRTRVGFAKLSVGVGRRVQSKAPMAQSTNIGGASCLGVGAGEGQGGMHLYFFILI